MSVDLEQHFININNNTLEKCLLPLISNNFDRIIEFGAGKGDFTKHFLNSGKEILAYEIDSSLKKEFDLNTSDNCKFIEKDLREDIEIYDTDLIISAPPYSLLYFINEKYLKGHKYIIMIPEKYLNKVDGVIIYTLNGSDFIPESRGKHYIITNL